MPSVVEEPDCSFLPAPVFFLPAPALLKSRLSTRAVDLHSFFSDPDPAVLLNVDPNPAGFKKADPDPA